MERYDVVIIGGGFFGCSLGIHISQYGKTVLVVEKEADIMTRASYNNQARVHGGYHYSRSLLTALRSRVNFADFVRSYEDCIESSFEKYYGVGRFFSKVTAKHFYNFCKRVGAEIEPAPKNIRKLFNENLVEDVFTVKEFAFDSLKLREKIKQKLKLASVELRTQTESQSLAPHNSEIIVNLQTGQETSAVVTKNVFNCSYSHINSLNHKSGIDLVPFKHEVAEMALIEVPAELQNLGITIMDGPFFSTMPFPPKGLHTLSHVRYTPHFAWEDEKQGKNWRNGHEYLRQNKPASAFGKMVTDAKRYVPLIGQSKYVDSLWEVKTILPTAEHDDSRPILFLQNHGGIVGYTCIMGGKIDNIQDVLREVDILYGR